MDIGQNDAIMNDPCIASIPFVDGVVREVFIDAEGKQYVLDADGNRVYGTWVYVDEPIIVERAEP